MLLQTSAVKYRPNESKIFKHKKFCTFCELELTINDRNTVHNKGRNIKPTVCWFKIPKSMEAMMYDGLFITHWRAKNIFLPSTKAFINLI